MFSRLNLRRARDSLFRCERRLPDVEGDGARIELSVRGVATKLASQDDAHFEYHKIDIECVTPVNGTTLVIRVRLMHSEIARWVGGDNPLADQYSTNIAPDLIEALEERLADYLTECMGSGPVVRPVPYHRISMDEVFELAVVGEDDER